LKKRSDIYLRGQDASDLQIGQVTVVSKRLGHANSQITLDVYSHAMKHDEETAAILWEEATGGIVARTRKQAREETFGKAGVTFRDSKKGLLAVNE
jgi:hypothetical protein